MSTVSRRIVADIRHLTLVLTDPIRIPSRETGQVWLIDLVMVSLTRAPGQGWALDQVEIATLSPGRLEEDLWHTSKATFHLVAPGRGYRDLADMPADLRELVYAEIQKEA